MRATPEKKAGARAAQWKMNTGRGSTFTWTLLVLRVLKNVAPLRAEPKLDTDFTQIRYKHNDLIVRCFYNKDKKNLKNVAKHVIRFTSTNKLLISFPSCL